MARSHRIVRDRTRRRLPRVRAARASSTNPEDVTLNLMRLLAVYLRDESPQKLDRFIATSHRVGPPPLL
ncbi:hypothetical protein [Corynebacterium afermentans]|uniref:hypothetical protein n=1 Tax=Corynebacterium afermentans TaxID=38286 RepID=UPI002573D060|nr:hypothetical protein [Corynebacterium afermentans]MDC7107836.1 hypothetical protein [Corynebacterium afermentans]